MFPFITRSLPVHEPHKLRGRALATCARAQMYFGRRYPDGSALLISLLLMAFLAVFGIGMSQLIVKSIRVERNVVEAGKAYFAAESGVERALYFHENRLPGYEVPESEASVVLTNGTSYEYEMSAQENRVPCLHDSDSNGEGSWRMIEVQESVSWPLFRYDAGSDDGTPGRVDLTHFELTYGLNRLGGVSGSALRWKILGIDDQGNTQAISGLLPFSGAQLEVLNQTDTANFFDSDPSGTAVNFPNYPLSTFLEDHTFNYLVLTNVIVPSAQGPAAQSLEINRLRVQLSTADGDFTTPDGSACEYTLIRSTGFAENTRQAIDSRVKLDEALPVFDFVLYQTN